MGGPLSAILADIDMIRSKNEAVRRLNPSFYKRSVDDIYTKRNKNAADVLLKNRSSLHTNIVPTIKNLKKFLDTKVVFNKDGTVGTFVCRKGTEFPMPCISKLPKPYKQNTIIGDLPRSERISPGFNTEFRAIKKEYTNADYPIRFIGSIINSFNLPPEDDVFVIIPPNLFDEKVEFLLTEVPYWERTETVSKHFIKKLLST